MSDVFEKLNDEVILRGFSRSTFRLYFRCIKEFLEYSNKPLHELNVKHIKKYLLYLLKEKKLKQSTTNAASSALKFFFNVILERGLPDSVFPFGKSDHKIPTILSTQEVEKLFQATKNIKNRALLMTAYGCGLRVSEVVRLRIEDVDSNRMLLFIRKSKEKKDRYVILPKNVLHILREYYRCCSPKEWLFPATRPGLKSPFFSMRGANRIFYNAKRRAKIHKKGGLHTLRHSFATHLLDAGENIFTIKELLGHANLKTTMIYLRLTAFKVKNFTSPIDNLKL